MLGQTLKTILVKIILKPFHCSLHNHLGFIVHSSNDLKINDILRNLIKKCSIYSQITVHFQVAFSFEQKLFSHIHHVSESFKVIRATLLFICPPTPTLSLICPPTPTLSFTCPLCHLLVTFPVTPQLLLRHLISQDAACLPPLSSYPSFFL